MDSFKFCYSSTFKEETYELYNNIGESVGFEHIHLNKKKKIESFRSSISALYSINLLNLNLKLRHKLEAIISDQDVQF